jgi:hypothetical protein
MVPPANRVRNATASDFVDLMVPVFRLGVNEGLHHQLLRAKLLS